MADRTSAPSRGRSATLEPPSLDETPLVTKFGLSDAEYAELQEKRKCFKGLSISPRPYTAYGALKERDMLAFCAAGYFLWRLGETEAEVLMAWEDRKGKRLLNFLGGVRDSPNEEPMVVAARETHEETGLLLSVATVLAMNKSDNKPVVWIPQSKYALFLLEVTEQQDQDIANKFAQLPKHSIGGPLPLISPGGDPGIVGLEWVRASDIEKNDDRNFHPFAKNMIQILIRSKILPFQTSDV